MIKTIKKPIANLPKNLQVHTSFLIEASNNKAISLDLYDKAKNHFARLFNKYMKDTHSKSYNYLLDHINSKYVIVDVEYIN